MNYLLSRHFKKQLKRYVRKDPTLAENLNFVLESFDVKYATSIGKGVYKIRIKAHNKGKSGGYRSYLLFLEVQEYIIPLCIYAKNEKENLKENELDLHLLKTIEEIAEFGGILDIPVNKNTQNKMDAIAARWRELGKK